MRRSRLWILVLAAGLACKAEVSEPELRRPLESMPAGACVLLLASDLANTWERAEAHDAIGVLKRALPAHLVAPPELQTLQERLAAFETRTATSLRQDLWLNLLQQRLAIGVYAEHGTDPAEILFVAELDDAERFGAALEALWREAGSEWQIEATRLDGLPATRVRDGERLDVVILQDGRFLAVSTADDLVRGALAIQHGTSQASALRDPACAEALEALGRMSVAIVNLGLDEGGWSAQGLTWDRDGVHFKRLVPVAAPPESAPETPVRRDDILRSIPAGMTLAYYARPTERELLRTLFDDRSCTSMHSSQRSDAATALTQAAGARAGGVLPAVAPPLGLDRLPFDLGKDMLPWAGDEMAVVLASLQPSTLTPLPNLAFIVEVADAEAAARSLGELEHSLGIVPGLGDRGFDDVSYGGKTYRSLSQPILESLAPSYLVDGGLAVIATTRELLQQIIDVRRVGRGHLLRDPTFRPLGRFVPVGASVAVYADQTKLHRASLQVASMPRLWGDAVERAVEVIEGLQVLFEHFPASAAYIERTADAITLQGWMLEAEE